MLLHDGLEETRQLKKGNFLEVYDDYSRKSSSYKGLAHQFTLMSNKAQTFL
jgi:hypothetical protein